MLKYITTTIFLFITYILIHILNISSYDEIIQGTLDFLKVTFNVYSKDFVQSFLIRHKTMQYYFFIKKYRKYICNFSVNKL